MNKKNRNLYNEHLGIMINFLKKQIEYQELKKRRAKRDKKKWKKAIQYIESELKKYKNE